ncbi:MAG: hypothetical protein EOO38_09525 [Cytophagaceae bacterium]|nr:MAG: hypothetical protein EOO38_09525 [Cytophagaceae bacterium]
MLGDKDAQKRLDRAMQIRELEALQQTLTLATQKVGQAPMSIDRQKRAQQLLLEAKINLRKMHESLHNPRGEAG